MQYFDINLAPGAVREINVQGSFVYFLSGSAGGADTTIELRAVSGADTVLLKPGQAFKYAGSNQRWVVSNHLGQGTIVGQLLMGEGDFSDNRISGSVEVIDGGKSRTQADTAFIGYAFSSAAVGNYSHVQIWNPNGSSKNIFIEQINFWSTGATANGVFINYGTAKLLTLVTNPRSKKIGGVASNTEIYVEQSAAAIGTQVMAMDGAQKLFKLTEPVMLAPGFGLAVINNTQNENIGAAIEFYEEGA